MTPPTVADAVDPDTVAVRATGSPLHDILPFGTFERRGRTVGLWEVRQSVTGPALAVEGILRHVDGGPLLGVSVRLGPDDARTDAGTRLLAAPPLRHHEDSARRGTVMGGDSSVIGTMARVAGLLRAGGPGRGVTRCYQILTRVTGLAPTDDEVTRHLAGRRAAAAAFLHTLGPVATEVLTDPRLDLNLNHLVLGGLDPEAGHAPLLAVHVHAPELLETACVVLREEDRPFPVVRSREELISHLAEALPRLGLVPRRRLKDLVPFAALLRAMTTEERHALTTDLLCVEDGDAIHLVGLMELLDRLPGNWVPRDDAERLAFMRLAPVVELATWRGGEDPAIIRAILDAGRGWADLTARLVAAAEVPPDRLVHAARDVTDLAHALAEQLLWPAHAIACGMPADARVAPHREGTWKGLAYATFVSGRTMARVLERSARWHRARDRMAVALADLPGGRSADATWPASLPGRASGGVGIAVLTDARALRGEGGRGADAEGTDGLDHCVGGYASRCASGECRILSLRREGGDGARLSTAEVSWKGGGITVVQHRGRRNGPPPPEAVAALDAYVAALAEDPFLVGPELRDPVPRPHGEVTVRDACGYDWDAPGAWEAARDLWAPFLPSWMRGLDPVAFGKALGPLPADGVQRWGAEPFRSRATPADDGPATPSPR